MIDQTRGTELGKAVKFWVKAQSAIVIVDGGTAADKGVVCVSIKMRIQIFLKFGHMWQSHQVPTNFKITRDLRTSLSYHWRHMTCPSCWSLQTKPVNWVNYISTNFKPIPRLDADQAAKIGIGTNFSRCREIENLNLYLSEVTKSLGSIL